MQINTNGQRNITLDFDAPKKFKLKKDGAEIPYIRTGKNSFRLGRNIDGVLDLEEVNEPIRLMQPVALQPQQMAVINTQDVDRLNEAVKQMALVNPADVLMINNAAEQLDRTQNFIAEEQNKLEQSQIYLDSQQQKLNESAVNIQALETNNAERLDNAEVSIYNIAEGLDTVKTATLDNINSIDSLKAENLITQATLETKADKVDVDKIKEELEEYKDDNESFKNALSNYSGGLAVEYSVSEGGKDGQILTKITDETGVYGWKDPTPVIVKSETMPTASEKYKDEVYQYVGETGDYTHGYIYECQQNGTSYEWVRIDVQPNTAVWGQITGTLSDQTDLQEALNLKANKSYVDSQDNNLQQQIDAITAASDVTDIVGTYAQLQAYDTSTLPNNSIIKVLQDESRNNETTYYRWVITGGVGAWVLIGEEGPYYTKSETNTLLTAKQDTLVSGTNIKTVNGTSLLGSGNLSVAADINPYISNCITEIPQDIKLELNNGTITLKSGSKVYVPNGVGVFDTVTISSDITVFQTGSGEKMFICLLADNHNIYTGYMTGGTVTERPSSPINYAVYYNTTTNICEAYWSGTWHTLSFPIAIVTRGNSGFSIDQVFNGFGYIGSTAFVLPGVKGLIPKGRNADGTLKNTEFSVNGVLTRNTGNITVTDRDLLLNATYIGFTECTYNNEDNLLYNTDEDVVNAIEAGKITTDGSKITSLTSKTAFHAVDYNDFSNLKNTVDTNDSNTVHKTGNETISGEKTTTAQIEMRSTNGSTSPVLLFHIPNVRYSRLIETSDGLTVQEGGGTTLDRLYAGSSDAINTVVTTVAKSKTENGYFKLGNGLIIQFGLVTNMSNNKAWVNFSIPFTAVPQVVTTSDKDGVNDGYNSYVSGTTTTGFNAFNKEYGTSVNCWVHWIAVGY